MILIYTHRQTNRIKFIFGFIFRQILGCEFRITDSKDEFSEFQGPKMSYSNKALGGEVFIASSKLLFDHGILHMDINISSFLGLPSFFPVHHANSAFPFDPFAASFYLVSRYEEYLPFKKDQYGRFNATESIAYQHDFLHKPLVNIWAQEIKKVLIDRFPDLVYKTSSFSFTSTIDIDAAWIYKGKGVFRTVGGFFRSILQLNIHEAIDRLLVLLGQKKDPFDTFDFIHHLKEKYHHELMYFILFADYGHNDKNISVFNLKFQSLIKSLADHANVGIHPSFNSNFHLSRLKSEIQSLSRVLNREISFSRQHFLKVEFPITYRNLINLGITHDFTLGYAGMPGFRASTCTPFYFYDLDLDRVTNLQLHPFAFMEVTLRDYLELSETEALITIKELATEVKKVNGEFVSLWHNESLSNYGKWKGWNIVYKQMIKYCTELKNDQVSPT